MMFGKKKREGCPYHGPGYYCDSCHPLRKVLIVKTRKQVAASALF
jgi:hypothetical protein